MAGRETNETNETKGTQCPVQHHHSECPVLIASHREYRKAADMGPSVFCTIRDALGLDPKYKPHRNVDAVRCAKLMSKFIKQKQCRRAMSIEGRLTWRFNDIAAYHQALDTLQLEMGVHTECMFVSTQ